MVFGIARARMPGRGVLRAHYRPEAPVIDVNAAERNQGASVVYGSTASVRMHALTSSIYADLTQG